MKKGIENNSEYIISMNGISSGYDDKIILENLNFNVKPSEIITVIGGSGSGKSTLLKTIMRFCRIFSGELIIDGERIDHLRESNLYHVRQKMGMVFQGAALFDSMTVFENVAFPLAEKRLFGKKEIKEKVIQVLEQLGMIDARDSFPDELSGGMQKRAGLARALVEKPSIILYDEPTSGLDPIMAGYVNEMIYSTREDFGVTSVVVSHDMPSVFAFSDRISAIFNNTIIQTGTPDEIMNSEIEEVHEFIHSIKTLDN
ncbi:ATP-binding cassette domain-containing protein [bacterium]|nr:ATP-binding cassette domain-containing protein [bacterium]